MSQSFVIREKPPSKRCCIRSSFYIGNFMPLANTCSWAGRFESYLVENPEDRFSRDEAAMVKPHQSKLRIMKMFEPPHDKTNKMTAPSEDSNQPGPPPSLITQWVAKDPSFLHADSEDSEQTGRMPRLIWVFAGCTCHFVGFVMRWLRFLFDVQILRI